MTDFLKIALKTITFSCSALSVPEPSVQIAEPSTFASPTTKCDVSSDGTELRINRIFADSTVVPPLIWLAMSHECRHIWQAFNTVLFNNYKQSSELSVRAYNEQAAEIDAWAWAVLVVSRRFGIRPTLEKNFGADIWQLIETRAGQIADEKLI